MNLNFQTVYNVKPLNKWSFLFLVFNISNNFGSKILESSLTWFQCLSMITIILVSKVCSWSPVLKFLITLVIDYLSWSNRIHLSSLLLESTFHNDSFKLHVRILFPLFFSFNDCHRSLIRLGLFFFMLVGLKNIHTNCLLKLHLTFSIAFKVCNFG